jgi:thiol-disulfide isomerase/thioredoxin
MPCASPNHLNPSRDEPPAGKISVRAISSLVDLKKLSGGRKLTVIDFFANWCCPCKMIAPKVESLASNYPTLLG